MRYRLQLFLFVATIATAASSALGQSAVIDQVEVSTPDNNVTVEIELTAVITPTVSFAKNPSRLIADFPNTTPKELLQHIPVAKNGVERVRIGLNRAHPPITRVVVDLDEVRPFKLEAEGTKIVLGILPSDNSAQARGPDAASSTKASNAIIEETSTSWSVDAVPLQTPSPVPASIPPDPSLAPHTLSFKVKAIAADAVYLNGGSNSGLRKGMKLIVHESTSSPRNPNANPVDYVAELQIISVATASSVAEVHAAKRPLRRGDRAFLAPDDQQAARIAASTAKLPAMRKPPPSMSFLSGTQAPRRSSAELTDSQESSIRARVGLDYSGITSSGSTPGSSTQMGMSFQSDMTNLFGTHWNLQGYWRGRINRHAQFQEHTIEETLDKTYTMQLYYDNPDARWVAGVGRLYLPWAVSLDTIDGGYLGHKLGGGITAGIFAGSTPDLTSWDYAPDHRIGGSFVNFTGGDYDSFHFSSTTGFGLSTLDWKLDRPFLFAENEFSYKKLFSIYHSLIADSPQGVTTDGIRPGAGISHSYLTVHLQPSHRLYFDVYHNYFRDVPTAATRLVGTGLVDKLLFQGVNAGIHFEPMSHVMVYTTLGRSDKTGDTRHSLNQIYGLTWSEIAHSGIRADFHYSKFDSNFGSGDYRLLSLSRQITNVTFWNVQVGDQNLSSPLSANDQSKFFATSLDLNLGKHSFLQSGYTFVQGNSLNYRQWYSSLGFRLDHQHSDGSLMREPDENTVSPTAGDH